MLKTIFRFSLIVIAMLILFQLSKASLFVPTLSADLIIGIGAVILIGLGIYLGGDFKSKVEPAKEPAVDHKKIEELGLSQREMEVLQLISEGHSNVEIGERLFVSESTVKTHVSNLFVKLDVKRRTQAVTRAKELQILV